jgi:hypothetical protein
VYIENVIDFSRLYYNKFAVDLEDVRANLFLELRMYFDSSVCVGVGYAIDNVLFKLEMAQKFVSCSKTVLKSLCDFSNWQGNSAKWLDSCELSEDVTVSLYEVEPVANSVTNYFYGGDTFDTTKGCYKLIPGMLPFSMFALESFTGFLSSLISSE